MIAFISALFMGSLFASGAEVDWKQPNVACVEEIVPQTPFRQCPDFSKVQNVLTDWPEELPASEKEYWLSRPKEVAVCRAREILSRENANPGSQKPVSVEIAWMQANAILQSDSKIHAIYDASVAYGVPVQVLVGALSQESLFADLGISEDGDNFSCGIGQMNVLEWCRWVNTQSESVKLELGWPLELVRCDSADFMQTRFVRPFHALAKARLGSLPEYRLRAHHFAQIQLSDVMGGLPNASAEVQKLRFQVIQSFTQNCSDARFGILAKAHELAHLYRTAIPLGLQKIERYGSRERHRRGCIRDDESRVYPLQTAWLLAVAAYNAGPRVVDAVAHFNRLSSSDLSEEETWKDFNPQALILSLYGAGIYDSASRRITFRDLSGSPVSWSWYKACVVQRHVARVIQRAALSPQETLAQSYEGSAGCSKTGEPSVSRQNSRGRKP